MKSSKNNHTIKKTGSELSTPNPTRFVSLGNLSRVGSRTTTTLAEALRSALGDVRSEWSYLARVEMGLNVALQPGW